MNYLINILILVGIYFLLSMSLNVLVGYTGLLSLCQAAFFGVGAYATTLLTTRFYFPAIDAMLSSVFLTMVLSWLVGRLSLRLKSDYFVLFSIGLQIIVFSVLENWISLTRGPYGIAGIPSPRMFGLVIGVPLSFLALTVALTVLCFTFLFALLKSPFGLSLRAIREDEVSAQALGKNPLSLKLEAFMVAGAIAAVAGSIYAWYITYIDPTSFTLDESIFILVMVLIGGSGNIRGPLVGALFVTLLPEVLRFVGIPDAIAPNIRQMVYGASIVGLMMFRPQGIAGDYKFE